MTSDKTALSSFASIVDAGRYPLLEDDFQVRCRLELAEIGALVLPGFLLPAAVERVRAEGEGMQDQAYFCVQNHNVYLTTPDPDFAGGHPRNREVVSSKGLIADDQIVAVSALRILYDAAPFRSFLCAVLGEAALYPYADPLASIGMHYARPGQELGWHFDNSSFATTLMIRPPEAGGAFEYVRDVRDADSGDMNFDGVARILDGDIEPRQLAMPAGALVLFRGRNALHRVAPVEGSATRMLAVLAYNSEPGIALSESARMTFFGRLE